MYARCMDLMNACPVTIIGGHKTARIESIHIDAENTVMFLTRKGICVFQVKNNRYALCDYARICLPNSEFSRLHIQAYMLDEKIGVPIVDIDTRPAVEEKNGRYTEIVYTQKEDDEMRELYRVLFAKDVLDRCYRLFDHIRELLEQTGSYNQALLKLDRSARVQNCVENVQRYCSQEEYEMCLQTLAELQSISYTTEEIDRKRKIELQKKCDEQCVHIFQTMQEQYEAGGDRNILYTVGKDYIDEICYELAQEKLYDDEKKYRDAFTSLCEVLFRSFS